MKKFFFLTAAVALTTLFLGCNKNMDAPELGVEIGGYTWATRNVDTPGKFAANPEDPGMYYQWNRKKGWQATGAVAGWNSSPDTGTAWVSANDPCPAGWQVPSQAQYTALRIAGYIWEVTKKGGIFGSGANTIFLPATGWRNWSDGSLSNVDENGNYWSREQDFPDMAYELIFNSSSSDATATRYKAFGHSIRCVKK